MNKIPFTDIKEALTRALSSKDSNKAFSKLPAGLVELVYTHFELIATIENIRQLLPESQQITGFDTIIQNFEANIQFLLGNISNITSRKILIHTMVEGDTLWKIAKKYNSEIHEISELNNTQNIFLTAERRFLLIPVK